MAVGEILLDTNAYAEYKRGNQRVLELLTEASSIVLSPIVMGELYAGFALGNREKENISELDRFLAVAKTKAVTIDEQTSLIFAKVFCDLRRQGTPIPTNDMWIAASAFQHGLKVLSFDKHFQQAKGLELLNPNLA